MNQPANHDETSTSHFQLTQPELLFTLRALDLTDIPGVGDKPWGEIGLEQARLQFREAGLGLKSRGSVWLNEKTGQPAVEKSLQSVLSACAYPQEMMALVYQKLSAPVTQLYYYHLNGMTVRHTLPQKSLHDFQVDNESDMGQSALAELFDGFSWTFEGQLGEVTLDAYEQAMQIVITNERQATRALVDNGLTPNLCGKFIEGVREHKVQAHVQMVYQFQPHPKQNILIFFAGDSACWLVEKVVERRIMRIKAIHSKSLQLLLHSAFQAFSV